MAELCGRMELLLFLVAFSDSKLQGGLEFFGRKRFFNIVNGREFDCGLQIIFFCKSTHKNNTAAGKKFADLIGHGDPV